MPATAERSSLRDHVAIDAAASPSLAPEPSGLGRDLICIRTRGKSNVRRIRCSPATEMRLDWIDDAFKAVAGKPVSISIVARAGIALVLSYIQDAAERGELEDAVKMILRMAR